MTLHVSGNIIHGFFTSGAMGGRSPAEKDATGAFENLLRAEPPLEISRIASLIQTNVTQQVHHKRDTIGADAVNSVVDVLKSQDFAQLINDVLVNSGGLAGIAEGAICGLAGTKGKIDTKG
ncbi:hypothetical protein H4219_000050 [Mycoemilia scoparia]|uniref:Uncharacterized protein n=1 Tax=Mycoemilia scoparia TaxID=417184 RepID=A0A9W8ABJ4_9FUNG|nr:hypothetical protein H4219_000050 [Mycoemilia scoparia]